MRVEQLVEKSKTRQIVGIVEVLKKIENKYFYARYLEISSLLSYFLDRNLLKKENLKGPILDLGTGSGIALLALREFGPKATLEGIDKDRWWYDRNWYTGFNYPIPLPGFLEAVEARFEQIDILDCLDLRNFYGQKKVLVTAFYANTQEWGDNKKLSVIMKEIGELLPPGGQFLLTSDSHGPPRPDWANEEFVLTGTSGNYSKTLLLPFPTWLRERYWSDIQNTVSNRDLLGLNVLLEDEIFETGGREIGLIRDSQIRLFTK